MKNSALRTLMSAGVASCTSASMPKPEMSERAAERLADFEPTGVTESCLNITHIRDMSALDDWRFLVRVNGGGYYLNETKSQCIGASRPGNRVEYRISGGQLCRNQIITIVDNASGVMASSCGLGDFKRLERVGLQVPGHKNDA